MFCADNCSVASTLYVPEDEFSNKRMGGLKTQIIDRTEEHAVLATTHGIGAPSNFAAFLFIFEVSGGRQGLATSLTSAD